MSRGKALLVALCLTLAACSREVPEDPAIASPAGIPMGAVGASGVGFDAPTARPDPPHAPKGKPGKPKVGIEPSEPVPDPFASPPDDDDDEPAPKPAPKGKGPKSPKTHSPSETTL
ncbi:MAG: hypothetical protein QM820_42165 [Minicystis sp.]